LRNTGSPVRTQYPSSFQASCNRSAVNIMTSVRTLQGHPRASMPRAPLEGTARRFLEDASEVPIGGPFPTALLRTARKSVDLKPLSRGFARTASTEAETGCGLPHLASLTGSLLPPPAPLRLARGFPALPGGTSPPRLLLALC